MSAARIPRLVRWARARRGALVFGALLAVALGALAAGTTRRPPPDAIAWPAGREQVYALSWTTHATSRALSGAPASDGEPPALESRVTLEGRLVLASYGAEGDATVLTARFEDLTRVDVSALGRDLLPSLDAARAELEGKSAELALKPSGEIADVRFRPRDPALFRYLMRAVVAELALELRAPANGTWTAASVEGPSGQGPVRFARAPERPLVVTRTRERYDTLLAWPLGAPPPQKLDSAAEIRLEPSGVLGELTDRETLEAARPGRANDVTSTTTFSLRRREERRFDASTRPDGFAPAAAAPEAGTETAEQRRERLARRSEGVTIDSIVDDLRVYSVVPEGKSTRWAWVASGYLELHPEKSAELAGRMRELDTNAKALTIDLLMTVGHAEAQAAIVGALRDGLVAPGVERALLLQRMARIERPTKATAVFVSELYAAAKAAGDVPTRRSAAIALGGLVSGLAETDRLAARELDDPLVLDLHAATDPKDREILLLSLGNAGLEEDAIAIRLSSAHASYEVRAAVATALRRVDGPEIRRTLLELFADPHPRVQLDALTSLDRRAPTEGDLEVMLATLEKGGVDDGNLEALLNYLARRKDAAIAKAMLDLIASRDDIDARTRARAARIREGA